MPDDTMAPSGAAPPMDAYLRSQGTREGTMDQGSPSFAGAGGPGNAERAERLKDAAASRARDEAGKHKETVASELKNVSSALKNSTGELDEGSGWAGKILGEAAEQMQRTAEALDSKSPDDLMRDARRFARHNPTMYLAGCAALGFAAARLLRAEPEGGTGNVRAG